MTSDERIRKLEAEVADLRNARDLAFVEALRRRVFQGTVAAGLVDTTLADLNETTAVPGGGGDVVHAEAYDSRVRVTIDGTDYFIGLYTA